MFNPCSVCRCSVSAHIWVFFSEVLPKTFPNFCGVSLYTISFTKTYQTVINCLVRFYDRLTIPGASDSARYKALGNSVAIPCVEVIMSRIAAALL